MTKRPAILILAVGEARPKAGKPFFSTSILGKTILDIVLDAVSGLQPGKIVVAASAGHADIEQAISHNDIRVIGLDVAEGIAGLVLAARKAFAGDKENDLLIMDAALPLLSAGTLRALLKHHRVQGNVLTFLSDDQRKDTGVYVCRTRDLFQTLPGIKPIKTEIFPLVGLIEALFAAGKRAAVFEAEDPFEITRIETSSDLAKAAAVLRKRKIRELADRGVLILDPDMAWIDLGVRIGRGTVVYPSVVIEGETRIGSDGRILPYSHLSNVTAGDRVIVRGSSVIEDSRLENDVQVGPFARIRPGTVIRKGAHVGNFVEMKKTDFGPKSKAGHLSYLGDSLIGADVNIGAGTITCNYDGVKKNRTEIGSGAFIGSGTELVAPVKIGKGAYVAAGSTITKDVSADALAIARQHQTEKTGWAKARRVKIAAERKNNKRRPEKLQRKPAR